MIKITIFLKIIYICALNFISYAFPLHPLSPPQHFLNSVSLTVCGFDGMEALQFHFQISPHHHQQLNQPNFFMNSHSLSLSSKLLKPTAKRFFFSTSSSLTSLTNSNHKTPPPKTQKPALSTNASRVRAVKTSQALEHAQLKENWLDSLTCPLNANGASTPTNATASNWVIGVDPDIHGALALLNFNTLHSSISSAQVKWASFNFRFFFHFYNICLFCLFLSNFE